MITLHEVKQLLIYNPKTGIFKWMLDRGNRVKKNSIAGCINKSGYVTISINGKSYQAHNLAWLFLTGTFPIGIIDHINRIRDDNSANNLRDVSLSDNCRNRKDNCALLVIKYPPAYRVGFTLPAIVSRSEVISLLEYKESDGLLLWKEYRGQRIKPGDIAGSTHDNGCIYVKVKGRRYLAHRLIWLIVYGEFPTLPIDHIDRNPSNNKLENLRISTISENNSNRNKFRNNTSGYTGVQLDKRSGKWRALTRKNGKIIYLGLFINKKDANQAYQFYIRNNFT